MVIDVPVWKMQLRETTTNNRWNMMFSCLYLVVVADNQYNAV